MYKIVIFNAESAYFFFRDRLFYRTVRGASQLLCDSASLSLALSARGVVHGRLHGPDFMDLYLRQKPSERVLIIGGSRKAHSGIQARYGLRNARFIDRRIGHSDLDDLMVEIDSFAPRAIFVCLGLRKQEVVADAIWQKLSSSKSFSDSFVVGVGAAVDFLGGTKVRSGKLWRNLGLEWLPRLMREPRMAPRIFRSLIGCFLVLCLAHQLERDELTFACDFPV